MLKFAHLVRWSVTSIPGETRSSHLRFGDDSARDLDQRSAERRLGYEFAMCLDCGPASRIGLTSAILAYLFPRDAVIGLAFGRQVAGKVINRANEDGSGPVPALTPAQGSAAS